MDGCFLAFVKNGFRSPIRLFQRERLLHTAQDDDGLTPARLGDGQRASLVTDYPSSRSITCRNGHGKLQGFEKARKPTIVKVDAFTKRLRLRRSRRDPRPRSARPALS